MAFIPHYFQQDWHAFVKKANQEADDCILHCPARAVDYGKMETFPGQLLHQRVGLGVKNG